MQWILLRSHLLGSDQDHKSPCSCASRWIGNRDAPPRRLKSGYNSEAHCAQEKRTAGTIFSRPRNPHFRKRFVSTTIHLVM